MESITSAVLATFSISPFGETYLPAINGRQFEKTDSQTIYNEKYSDLFKYEEMLHIFIGMDSGLLTNYILEHEHTPGSYFIFVELPEVLQLLNIELDKQTQQKIKICDESQLEDILENEGCTVCIAKKRYMFHLSLAAANQSIIEYSLLYKNIQALLTKTQFELNQANEQKIFVNKQLQNITENRFPISLLKNQLKHHMAVVLGGGPSLDEHLNWIKKNQDFLLIIAVSRVAGKLIAAGINPDFVVTVDPKNLSFDVSRQVIQYSDKLLLVNAYHATNTIIGQWQGPKLYMGSRFPWQDNMPNLPVAAPTVTNSAIALAAYIGCKQILLSGVDLCHSRSGLSHTKGTDEATLGPSLGQPLEWTETYKGELVESPSQLLQAAQQIAEQASMLSKKQIEVFNLSENAAKIASVTHRTPEDMRLPQSRKMAVMSMVMSLTENQESQCSYLQDLQYCFNEVKTTQQALSAIEKLTYKAKIQCEQAVKHEALDAKLSSLLEKTESKLNKKYLSLTNLIKGYGFYEFSFFLTSRQEDEWDEKQILLMNSSYYQAYYAIAHNLRLLLDETLSRISSRLSELNKATSFAELAKQWRKDMTPGRVIIREQLINDNCPITLRNELLAEYQQQQHHTYLAPESPDALYYKIFSKIIFLQQKHHYEGLDYLARNLALLVDKNDQYKQLYSLALAYKLEIENKPEEALQSLLTTPEEQRSQIELKYISQLALKTNNLPLTENTLCLLQSKNDQFKPAYAQVLKIQGKNQQALNIYLDYVEKYPKDILTLLKLAEFLVHIAQHQAAISVYTQVLELAPDNIPARVALQSLRPAIE